MTKYVLVSFKTCPWVQRAAIVLREKKIAFEFQHIEPNNRPDWFRAISPHNKVPVLRIDEAIALFESGAIAEYLDELPGPRLHPSDPIERALNRAWIEYLPSFVDIVSGHAYADDKASYDAASARIPAAFEKLEKALSRHDRRPYFNGANYSLVDAAYAPFLQRHLLLEGIDRQGHIDRFPRVSNWAQALVERPSTHSFPPAEFEGMYRQAVKERGKWISQFVSSRPDVSKGQGIL